MEIVVFTVRFFKILFQILGKAGVTVGLVSLCKTESENCKELIAR